MASIKILADDDGRPVHRVPAVGEKYIIVWGAQTDITSDDGVSVMTATEGSDTIAKGKKCLIVDQS